MIERTVRKGERYELPTGVQIPAACDGLVRDGRIITVPSMVAALHQLGWTCKRPKGGASEPADPSGD